MYQGHEQQEQRVCLPPLVYITNKTMCRIAPGINEVTILKVCVQ